MYLSNDPVVVFLEEILCFLGDLKYESNQEELINEEKGKIISFIDQYKKNKEKQDLSHGRMISKIESYQRKERRRRFRIF